MKNSIYLFFALLVLLQFFTSCSGETKSENKKNDTIPQSELQMDIDNTDWVIMATDSTLPDIDFTNFSYLLEEGVSATVTNGESYINDSTGYDSVYISNESLRYAISEGETKLIELDRHYGSETSNAKNYIFAFRIIDHKLTLTGSLKYTPQKRASFDGPVLILYPHWSDPSKNTDSQLIKSWVQVRNGNFEVIKSEPESEK